MKNRSFFIAALLCASIHAGAQTYADDIRRWQQHYKEEFLTDPRSPVKGADTGFIRFYKPERRWVVTAAVLLTPDAKAVDIATHSGKTKRYRPWATLRFTAPESRGGLVVTLTAYERVDLPAGDTVSGKTLFIPFNDETNGSLTYGGGRYMDVAKAAISGGRVLLDFNRAYNPYCAFGEGFSCPIPPVENKLPFAVKAGEKMWAKKAQE